MQLTVGDISLEIRALRGALRQRSLLLTNSVYAVAYTVQEAYILLY